MNYQIISDRSKLDTFIDFLPKLEANEVYYLSLFGRHKYCPTLSNKQDNQLNRFVSTKEDLVEKITRLECPLGGYKRDGENVPQESLAIYISLNPRNLVKANKNLLLELVKCCTDGEMSFNPVSLINTAIHRAIGRKVLIDFDYDGVNYTDYLPQIRGLLPEGSFRIMETRGGFHLFVILEKVQGVKANWFKTLSSLKGCDVKGSNTLVPVAGCYQGGFIPYLIPAVPMEV
jgi:hypothetical protein